MRTYYDGIGVMAGSADDGCLTASAMNLWFVSLWGF